MDHALLPWRPTLRIDEALLTAWKDRGPCVQTKRVITRCKQTSNLQESLQVCAVYYKFTINTQEADSVYKLCVLCLNVNKIGGSYDKIKATQAISLGVVCLHCTLTTTQMATNSWYFILSLISRLYYGDIYGYEYSLLSYVYFYDCRRIHTHTHCQLCNNTTTKVSLLIPPRSPQKSFIFKNWMFILDQVRTRYQVNT